MLWHTLKYYSDICIEGLRTTMNISQDGQTLGGDWNPGPPNYDAEGITN
jgi:hypothetical protein